LCIVALCSLAAVGCGDVVNPNADGGSDGGGGGGGDGGSVADANTGPDAFVDPCLGTVDYDDFWSCAMDIVCDVFVGCLGDGADNCAMAQNQVFLFGNEPLIVTEQLFTEAIAAGTMTYDGAAAGACMEAIANEPCWELFGQDGPFDNCGIFVGNVANTGNCFNEEECAGDGSQCIQGQCGGGQDVCCVGQCRTSIPIGGNCGNAQCVPDAYCFNNVCQAGEVGDQCGGEQHCDDDHHCAPNSQCAADLSSGSVCAGDEECDLPQTCLGDDLPNSTMGNCGDNYQAGDSCDGGCLAFGTLWCDQPNPNSLGTCRAIPGLGESCVDSGSCGFFLDCDPNSQMCVERAGDGVACTGNDCEFFLFCDNQITNQPNGVCDSPRTSGAQCDSDDHCQSGICNNGLCSDYPGCFP
jgi:hypothetical protein